MNDRKGIIAFNLALDFHEETFLIMIEDYLELYGFKYSQKRRAENIYFFCIENMSPNEYDNMQKRVDGLFASIGVVND